jgi:hypothetical protein
MKRKFVVKQKWNDQVKEEPLIDLIDIDDALFILLEEYQLQKEKT